MDTQVNISYGDVRETLVVSTIKHPHMYTALKLGQFKIIQVIKV